MSGDLQRADHAILVEAIAPVSAAEIAVLVTLQALLAGLSGDRGLGVLGVRILETSQHP